MTDGDTAREIFPVRINSTENVNDFRPIKSEVDIPDADEDDDDPKVGNDSALASASSQGSQKSSEPKTLTTGVQLPAAKGK